MRIILVSQVIQIYFGEWDETVVLVYRRLGLGGDIQVCSNPPSNLPKYTECPKKAHLWLLVFSGVIYYM